MDDDSIRVHPTEIEYAPRQKHPPTDNSDFWRCWLERDKLDVYFHSRAKRAILQHAQETPRQEVGGVLVGGLFEHRYAADKPPYAFVEVTQAVRGEFTRGRSTSLTFTPDTWSQIIAKVEHDFPDQQIVGWYHTHPGFGVFLSSDDKFVQNNFFGHSAQLALVVDHIQRKAAFFAGSDARPDGILRSEDFSWDEIVHTRETLAPPIANIEPAMQPVEQKRKRLEWRRHTSKADRQGADEIVLGDASSVSDDILRIEPSDIKYARSASESLPAPGRLADVSERTAVPRGRNTGRPEKSLECLLVAVVLLLLTVVCILGSIAILSLFQSKDLAVGAGRIATPEILVFLLAVVLLLILVFIFVRAIYPSFDERR